MSDKKQKFSFRYQLKTFRFAFQGIGSFFTHEHKALIHTVAAITVVGAALTLKLSLTEWALITFAITLVLVTEIINSAIESVVDLVSSEQHPLAGRAKDLAAGAVLLSSLGAVAIGLFVFLPKIIAYVI